MQRLLRAVWITALVAASGCRTSSQPESPELLVKASCGQCSFGLEGDGCDLAIRLDGRAYFVDGSGIDDHGDAHAADGMCNAVRSARVVGHIAGNRFVATSFTILPE